MITIGTRGSKLALYQANKVAELLKNLGYDVEIKIIKTTGDRVLDKKLSDIGIGVFTKELDLAMLSNKIDIAVHSLKDIPTIWNENLMVGAVLERDSYYDLLIWNKDVDFDENSEIVIGTSSLRRRAFLRFIYPNAKAIRVIKDSSHDKFLKKFNYLYSTSANESGKGFDRDFAFSKADIIVEDRRGFSEENPSKLMKLSKKLNQQLW